MGRLFEQTCGIGPNSQSAAACRASSSIAEGPAAARGKAERNLNSITCCYYLRLRGSSLEVSGLMSRVIVTANLLHYYASKTGHTGVVGVEGEPAIFTDEDRARRIRSELGHPSWQRRNSFFGRHFARAIRTVTAFSQNSQK